MRLIRQKPPDRAGVDLRHMTKGAAKSTLKPTLETVGDDFGASTDRAETPEGLTRMAD